MKAGDGTQARLYVDNPLQAGCIIELAAGQAHYLKQVLRLARGAKLAVFNGRDGEWRGRIETLGRQSGTLIAEAELRGQSPEPDLWLLFAPIKKARLNFLVQKAVELGVAKLMPVYTEHTEIKRLNVERHRGNVIEAAEQCERLTLPAFMEPLPIDKVLETFPTDRQLLVCAERGNATPLYDVVSEPEATARRGAILCGPEGGFSQTELDAFAKLSFIKLVSLGPRILRAETAAVSAVACWQAALGDWRRRPSE